VSSDQEEVSPLVYGKKDKGESSETSLEDEDEENKTKSTTLLILRRGQRLD
jgi:hypothetical protein